MSCRLISFENIGYILLHCIETIVSFTSTYATFYLLFFIYEIYGFPPLVRGGKRRLSQRGAIRKMVKNVTMSREKA